MLAYILDFLLILFAVLGILLALLFPDVFIHLSPYAIICVASTQFLNFLAIRVRDVFRLNARQAGEVALWSAFKLIILPLLLWPLTSLLAPELVPGMLMATGIATAVMAPMIAGFLRGDVIRVMQVVFITSAIMPLSLPFLMRVCLGTEIHFDLFKLGLLLGAGVILPSILAVVLRMLLPGVAYAIQRTTPFVGRALTFFLAAALVAPYGPAIMQDASHALLLSFYSFAAVLICSSIGFLLCLLLNLPATTGMLVLGFANFGLSAATSSYFLGQDATIVAIGFMLPGLLPIPFLRMWAQRRVYQPFETI